MTENARIDSRLAGLLHPNGESISLNKQKFVAIDRQPEKATRIIERRIEHHHANMVLTLEGIAALAEGRA